MNKIKLSRARVINTAGAAAVVVLLASWTIGVMAHGKTPAAPAAHAASTPYAAPVEPSSAPPSATARTHRSPAQQATGTPFAESVVNTPSASATAHATATHHPQPTHHPTSSGGHPSSTPTPHPTPTPTPTPSPSPTGNLLTSILNNLTHPHG
jgi:chitinase